MRRFILNYAWFVNPITNILIKDQYFEWTPESKTKITNIKATIVSCPILVSPDYRASSVVINVKGQSKLDSTWLNCFGKYVEFGGKNGMSNLHDCSSMVSGEETMEVWMKIDPYRQFGSAHSGSDRHSDRRYYRKQRLRHDWSKKIQRKH